MSKIVLKTFKISFKENRSLLLFLILMFSFRSAIADWNTVPTGSMQPTIVEGDRITVNKIAYDIRLPFSNHSIYQHADPERGDIVVFNSEAADLRLIKRVIGIPGDTIELNNNRLTINGKAVGYSTLPKQAYALSKDASAKDYLENLPEVQHKIRINNAPSRLASFPELMVPKKHYLVLGDNRDNSADSRVIGFVPRKEILGKSTHVVMSFNYDNFYIPRKERFFKALDNLGHPINP